MLEAINLPKQSSAWRKDNGQFIPHAATWFANQHWKDSVQPDLPDGSVWDDSLAQGMPVVSHEYFYPRGQVERW